MKLRGLVPNFYIHVSGSGLYIPTIGLIWNLYYPTYIGRESSRLNCRRGEKVRELTSSRGLQQFPALPSATAKVHLNDQHTNSNWKITDHKWKQLILVVNFLFGLRENEIPNKTFILDSHLPFICSVSMDGAIPV
jgi:hypothetical protein